jgi:co-chaperonin GroES (HSP10)
MESEYRLFGATVLVEPEPEVEKVSGSALLVSQRARYKQTIGTIIAVGPGLHDDNGVIVQPMDELQVGDRVLYQPNVGRTLDSDDKKYILMFEYNILGKLEPGDEVTTGYRKKLI